MSKDNKHALSRDEGLIPELRFPEFKNEGVWEKDSIDNQFDLQDGYPFSSFYFTKDKKDSKQVIRITDINNQNSNEEKVYLPNSKIIELDISRYEVHSGDLLLSLTGAAGFIFFIWNADSSFINQRTMKISPKKQDNEALIFLLEPLIHSKINSIGTGQNNNLSKDALKEIEFPFPKPKEQRKLSSFITNLNDLLAAHSQKLALLKDHKKGLMQNLFPQLSESGFTRLKDDKIDTDELETENQKILKSKNPTNPDSDNVPKYRFKEFEKDGEWVEKTFEQLFEIGNGRDYKHLDKGEIPVYGSGGYMLSVNDYLYDGESVCIGRKGTIDKPMFWTGKFWTVDTLFYTHSFKNCLPKYIFYVFENINWRDHNEAGGVPSLSKTNIYKIELLLPPTIQEQQKIASCLSSLDALITAQAEKIEQLKWHKKGLMQGLFPRINN